jgi:hypothetical protein
LDYKIVKKAIDSRNKKNILFIYSIDTSIKNQDNFFNKIPSFLSTNIKKHRIKEVENFEYKIKKIIKKPKKRPVIIGT